MTFLFLLFWISTAYQGGSPVVAIDRSAGISNLSVVSPTGQQTFIVQLPEPINYPSVAVDGGKNLAYVADGTQVHIIDLTTMVILANLQLQSGGQLKSIAFDGNYKTLFGIWQTWQDVVSLVQLELSSGIMKTMYTLAETGNVYRCYYAETPHHYAVMLRGLNYSMPMNLLFIDTSTNKLVENHYIQTGVEPASFAIDYEHHNVWLVYWNTTTGSLNFGIIHMNGTMQQTFSSTTAFARAGPAATVDITTQYYYTMLYTTSGAYFAQYSLANGAIVTTPQQYDQQAIIWSKL